MPESRRIIGWPGLIAVIGLILILVVIVLPALPRAREASRRSSCQNNLKQWGIVMKMFASENLRGDLPPLSPIPDNWMLDLRAVYPEYLTDYRIASCPKSPYANEELFRLHNNLEHPGQPVGTFAPDCISSLFYIYTSFAITNDEQAIGLFESYPNVPYSALLRDTLDVEVPVWTDADEPCPRTPTPADIPVMWDRIPLNDAEFSHPQPGANVLYLDGHVAWKLYHYYNASTEFPVTRISAETFGSVLPQLSSDCYPGP